ncbi:hypothetical protein EJ05DRAFT_439702 [Pseudovirgaria hyperparasitica]|uniref:Septin-type G domain-containing protein n=1 Tax=Pseudovirgaria hyperparasitica TaxID=470096 RepID=A0A6A6W673_9PEZI|nr:uncharacterized protein EJ05DRAFT_439702 [Pseudovirgaria hyperparasitica]KAF2757460.1 hypothetical protein EJ05DRAFT_439702 [Pseudovirgaria hyperparasitica]
MSKKQKAQQELLRQRQAQLLPQEAPRLPSHSPLPTINTFGGEEARPDSVAIATGQFEPQQNARRTTSQGSLHHRSMNFSRVSPVPNPIRPPPIPGSNGEYVDPYPRTESMTHRGRYSYASSTMSSINSPRRVRRRKDPTPFNILVIGAKNSGKTSFINFLRTALALPANKRQQSPPQHPRQPESVIDSPFTSEYLETEIDHERVGITIWDSQGLEKNIVDLQLREMATFLEGKFEETFAEEQKVVRALGVWDTYIHCAFLVLDPVRLDANLSAAARSAKTGNKSSLEQKLIGGLDDDLDLQILRTLQGKTTVIPVISKADTITTKHMARLKKVVWDSLKQAKLDPLEALDLDESDSEALDERDEDDAVHSDKEDEEKSSVLNNLKEGDSSDETDTNSDKASTSPSSPPRPSPDAKRPTHTRKASAMSATIASSPSKDDAELPYLPMSIISPDIYEPEVIGRQFPWGFADPYNVEHCDFIRLKESIFREWRTELRAASRERWYEDWRTSRLNRSGDPQQRRVKTGDGKRRGPSPGSLMPLPNGAVRATSAGGYSSENTKPQYQPYRPPVQNQF